MICWYNGPHMKDLARIYVKAGDGGNGSVHFRHERYAPKGGPDGGDGGRGGDVVLVADENIESLLEFNFQKSFVAKDGEGGMGKKMHGKDRDDVIVHVPVGTMVWEISEELSEVNLRDREQLETLLTERRIVMDMSENGNKCVIARGGGGGRGNWHFRSASNQVPMEAEAGRPGEEKHLLLEFKVLADVGIVGLPNVGKSSLLAVLTRANPKIAGYPFTTLEPNLGVLRKNEEQSQVLVDVPGVVEQAWEGKGIGPWFLRHLERVATLWHIVAPDLGAAPADSISKQLASDYKIVRGEIEKYGRGLPEKEEIVVVNKMELIDTASREKVRTKLSKLTGRKVVMVSAEMREVAELL